MTSLVKTVASGMKTELKQSCTTFQMVHILPQMFICLAYIGPTFDSLRAFKLPLLTLDGN